MRQRPGALPAWSTRRQSFRDAAITRLLGANGRSGVPLYLYYPPGADKPVILPQILTEAEILAAIGS